MEKNKQYWEKRASIRDKMLEKSVEKIMKELKKSFVKASKEIKKELAYFYANKTDLTASEQKQLEDTLKAINRALDEMYHNEENLLNNSLIELYKDIYKESASEVDLEIAFNTINDRLIEEVVKTNWSGLTFSERIWENRRKLALAVKEELNKGLIRGDSLQDMANNLSKKLNSSYKDALRVVWTESCWVQNQATLDSYIEAGVKEYEYMAFIDKKTSPQCRELDGKVFKIEEAQAGVNLPPMHPHCRSTIVSSD